MFGPQDQGADGKQRPRYPSWMTHADDPFRAASFRLDPPAPALRLRGGEASSESNPAHLPLDSDDEESALIENDYANNEAQAHSVNVSAGESQMTIRSVMNHLPTPFSRLREKSHSGVPTPHEPEQNNLASIPESRAASIINAPKRISRVDAKRASSFKTKLTNLRATSIQYTSLLTPKPKPQSQSQPQSQTQSASNTSTSDFKSKRHSTPLTGSFRNKTKQGRGPGSRLRNSLDAGESSAANPALISSEEAIRCALAGLPEAQRAALVLRREPVALDQASKLQMFQVREASSKETSLRGSERGESEVAPGAASVADGPSIEGREERLEELGDKAQLDGENLEAKKAPEVPDLHRMPLLDSCSDPLEFEASALTSQAEAESPSPNTIPTNVELNVHPTTSVSHPKVAKASKKQRSFIGLQKLVIPTTPFNPFADEDAFPFSLAPSKASEYASPTGKEAQEEFEDEETVSLPVEGVKALALLRMKHIPSHTASLGATPPPRPRKSSLRTRTRSGARTRTRFHSHSHSHSHGHGHGHSRSQAEYSSHTRPRRPRLVQAAEGQRSYHYSFVDLRRHAGLARVGAAESRGKGSERGGDAEGDLRETRSAGSCEEYEGDVDDGFGLQAAGDDEDEEEEGSEESESSASHFHDAKDVAEDDISNLDLTYRSRNPRDLDSSSSSFSSFSNSNSNSGDSASNAGGVLAVRVSDAAETRARTRRWGEDAAAEAQTQTPGVRSSHASPVYDGDVEPSFATSSVSVSGLGGDGNSREPPPSTSQTQTREQGQLQGQAAVAPPPPYATSIGASPQPQPHPDAKEEKGKAKGVFEKTLVGPLRRLGMHK